jgi:hypothetical protein
LFYFGPSGCPGGPGTPPACEGPGTTSKTKKGPPLCNDGDTFVEEWDCPAGCTLRQCDPKATEYSLSCGRKGKAYYATCSTFFGFTGSAKYCHCCIQNKKATVLLNGTTVGTFGLKP